MLDTLIILITKNKTGDSSDKCNYRPISLATIMAKVLARLLNQQQSVCTKLQSAT